MTAPLLTPAEAATVARFDAAEPAPESLVERVAVALWAQENPQESWDDEFSSWAPDVESARSYYRRMAAAAVDVLRGDR